MWNGLSPYSLLISCIFYGILGAAQQGNPKILIDIAYSKERCIADTISGPLEPCFTYKMLTATEGTQLGDKSKMGVTFKLPSGRSISENLSKDASSGHQSCEETGSYELCFVNRARSSRETLRIELEENVVPTADGASQVDAPHLALAHTFLKDAQEVSQILIDELDETMRREQATIAEARLLSSRISMSAIFSVVILLSASAWQLKLLDRFFRSKKLI